MSNNKSRFRHFLLMAFFFLFILLLFGAAALVVMLTWNAVVPDVFGLPELSFRQAVLLCFMVKFLTEGYSYVLALLKNLFHHGEEHVQKIKEVPGRSQSRGRGHGPGYGSPNLRSHWENLDPDQRQAIITTIRKLHEGRHGGFRSEHGGRNENHDDDDGPGRGKPFRRNR